MVSGARRVGRPPLARQRRSGRVWVRPPLLRAWDYAAGAAVRSRDAHAVGERVSPCHQRDRAPGLRAARRSRPRSPGRSSFAPVPSADCRQFVWVDRAGRDARQARRSDRRRPAVRRSLRTEPWSRSERAMGKVSGCSTRRVASLSRLTAESGRRGRPRLVAGWKPGRVLVGSRHLSERARSLSGGEPRSLSPTGPRLRSPPTGRADGRYLLCTQHRRSGDELLVVASSTGRREPIRVRADRFLEADGQFSPDGAVDRVHARMSRVSRRCTCARFPGDGARSCRSRPLAGACLRWRRRRSRAASTSPSTAS